MAGIKGHFGGVVEGADENAVLVRVDTVCPLELVENGALVTVSRENFAPMGAGPYPAENAHVEGNVERDTPEAPNRYTNLTAIV